MHWLLEILELTSNAGLKWQLVRKVEWIDMSLGKPMHNGLVESFNGRLRDDCLGEHLFATLPVAKRPIEESRIDYITNRPRTALDWLTPIAFTTSSRQGKTGTEQTYKWVHLREHAIKNGEHLFLIGNL